MPMSPLTCPPPPQPDCPLYAQRLDCGADEPLRRAILMERRRSPGLAELVRAEAQFERPAIPILPPASEPESMPILDHLKEKGITP